jgi:membrane associated rhomboid family serine protease
MFNFTPVVRNLLIANGLFYLLQTSLLPQVTQLGSLFPLGSPYFQPWQFVTYMFLHDPNNFLHLLFNMFGLLSFGPMLEMQWGAKRFLTFWMLCGIGAGVLYQGVRYYELHKMEVAQEEYRRDPSGGAYAEFFRNYLPNANTSAYETVAAALQRDPQNAELIASTIQTVDAIVEASRDSPRSGMLGASGALFGVLFAFAYLFPNTKLIIFPLPIPIAAKYIVFAYAAFELYAGVKRAPGDNVAHFAHLAGLLIGFIILKFWEQGRQKFY